MIGDGKRINIWCYSCQIPFFFFLLKNNDFSNSLMSVLICDSVLDNFHCSFSLLVSNIENTELSVMNTRHKGLWCHSTNGALTLADAYHFLLGNREVCLRTNFCGCGLLSFLQNITCRLFHIFLYIFR